MVAFDTQSSIFDMIPTASIGSNHFFEINFDKCTWIIKACYTTMVKALENATLSNDHVQETPYTIINI